MSRAGLVLPLLLAVEGLLIPRRAAAGDPPTGAVGASPPPPAAAGGATTDGTATDTPGLPPAPPAPGAPPAAAPYPASPASPSPPPFPVMPPPPPPAPRRYGDQGTPELALGFGYGSSTGVLAAGGFRYFVVDTLAPGIEGTYVSGGAGGTAYGLALGALRFVPFRTTSMALVVTARGGRMFVADHDDGWAVGGGAGVLLMVSPSVGFEIGYEALRLEPSSFCADLGSCTLTGITLGLRVIP